MQVKTVASSTHRAILQAGILCMDLSRDHTSKQGHEKSNTTSMHCEMKKPTPIAQPDDSLLSFGRKGTEQPRLLVN